MKLVGESTAARLRVAGMRTIGDIHDAERAGARWWAFAPAIGPMRARQVSAAVAEALGQSARQQSADPPMRPRGRSSNGLPNITALPLASDGSQPQGSPDDAISDWFGSDVAARLSRAGCTTLGDVAAAAAGGGRWWALAPGIGEKRAKRIADLIGAALALPQYLQKPEARFDIMVAALRSHSAHSS